MAGFLNGPGFQKMRDYLRRTADAIWVIDCSPEGHQPDVPTRIFQGVQQPVCIVMVSRSKKTNGEVPTPVRFRALPEGRREEKFIALANIAPLPRWGTITALLGKRRGNHAAPLTMNDRLVGCCTERRRSTSMPRSRRFLRSDPREDPTLLSEIRTLMIGCKKNLFEQSDYH